MPIKFTINREKRLVHATCSGVVTADELMVYQKDTWITGNVDGFDGLFDASGGDFSQLNYSDLLPFARNAALVDQFVPDSKLAIVIADAKQKTISEFYDSAVKLLPSDSHSRTTNVFYTLEDAFNWLGHDQEGIRS